MSRIYNKFGIKLSILNALHKIAKQPNGTYGAIFEDDFFVERDFYDKLSTILQNVPEDFDAIKLSINQYDIMAGFKKVPLKKKYLQPIKRSFRKNGYGDWMHAKHISAKMNVAIACGNQFFMSVKKDQRKLLNGMMKTLPRYMALILNYGILFQRSNQTSIHIFICKMFLFYYVKKIAMPV